MQGGKRVKKFKLFFTVLITVALVFSLAACDGTEEPNDEGTDEPVEEVVYLAGTDAAFPPFEMLEGDKVVGFDADILQAIAEAADIKIELKHTGWDPLFNGLDNGSLDIGIAAITIRDDRLELYDFSDPYFEANQLIMVREDSDVTSLADLAGKQIGVQTATTGNFVVADAFGETYKGIKGYDDIPAAVDDLLLGRLDAIVTDNAVIQEYLKVVAKDGYKLIKDPSFEVEQYGIAFLKGRDDGLIEKVNEGLKQIKADGTYDQIFSKYFAE